MLILRYNAGSLYATLYLVHRMQARVCECVILHSVSFI